MPTVSKSPYIIIQARMGSTRLPGKVLLPLCGTTVLEVMLHRLSHFHSHIIIATTNDGSEKDIIEVCKRMNVRYYQGDTENVLARYYEAAVAFGAKSEDTIVRLTSDCPLMDQNILAQMLERFGSSSWDYYSNIFQRTFPRGLDIEIFTFNALERAFNGAATTFEKEHVTTYIHTTHADEFSIGSFTKSDDHSKYRLTLDEQADYDAIQEVYKQFACRLDFTYDELLEVLRKNPQIYDINVHVEQKKQ